MRYLWNKSQSAVSSAAASARKGLVYAVAAITTVANYAKPAQAEQKTFTLNDEQTATLYPVQCDDQYQFIFGTPDCRDFINGNADCKLSLTSLSSAATQALINAQGTSQIGDVSCGTSNDAGDATNYINVWKVGNETVNQCMQGLLSAFDKRCAWQGYSLGIAIGCTALLLGSCCVGYGYYRKRRQNTASGNSASVRPAVLGPDAPLLAAGVAQRNASDSAVATSAPAGPLPAEHQMLSLNLSDS